MIEAQLASLKTLFGAETDTDLARALGVDRSTIAQWRRRGQVSEKYQALTKEAASLLVERERLDEASLRAIRSLVFRDPSYHYWAAAALAALSSDDFVWRDGESASQRGRRLERLVAQLYTRCLRFSEAQLGKVRPEDEDDYQAIVAELTWEESGVP